MENHDDKKNKGSFWSNLPEIIKAIAAIITAIGGLAGLVLALNEVGALDRLKPTPSLPPRVLNLRTSCGSTYTIEASKAIELHYGGWFAKGLALATENANHLTVTLLIDGQEISGTKQEVQQVTTSWYPGASCDSTDYSDAFGTFYIANVDSLSPGEHSVQVIYSFDTHLTDGYNYDGYGPGELDPFQFTIVASP